MHAGNKQVKPYENVPGKLEDEVKRGLFEKKEKGNGFFLSKETKIQQKTGSIELQGASIVNELFPYPAFFKFDCRVSS